MAVGYVKLWRTLLDSEQMTDDWLCRLFVWCLLRANHTESVFKGQRVLPGQFVAGRNAAAAELKVSPSKWYRGIERLVGMGCISIEANSHWTTLTVNNWSTYQEDDKPARAASGQRREQQTDRFNFSDSDDLGDKTQPSASNQRTAGDTTSGQPVIQPADSQRTQYKNVRMKEGKNVRKETTNVVSSSEGELFASEPPVIVFDCVGKKPHWGLLQSQIDDWQQVYPNIDVLAECRKAHAWLLASPARRKTWQGMPKFLLSWLNRASDRPGGGSFAPQGRGPSGSVIPDLQVFEEDELR